MEKVGDITVEDLANIKACIKASGISSKGIDYNLVGVQGGKVYGTDGGMQTSYPIELTGDFRLINRDIDIMVKMGAGALQVDMVRLRGKYIVGTSGYVFDIKPATVVNHKAATQHLDGNGFNMLLSDIRTFIDLAKSNLVGDNKVMYLETNPEEQLIHIFIPTGDKDWGITYNAKVKGHRMVVVGLDAFEKVISTITNKRLKFMFGVGITPCAINNDYALALYEDDNTGNHKKMVDRFPTSKELIEEYAGKL